MEIKMTREEKIAALRAKEKYELSDLLTVVELLRSPGGCPWDMEQDHKSIRDDFIEETYEVIEAIDTENPELLCEELGDVLLQVVFHTRIEEEKDVFCMTDVISGICAKLIHRHPHVFGEVKVSGSEQVLANWEQIKSEEKSRITVTEKLRAVPPQLPALMRATKVGKKAKCFDFANADEVLLKLDEEKAELLAAAAENDTDAMEEEMGDYLLTVTSLCRKLGINAENALNRATDKFIDRFENVENAVIEKGLDINELSMQELDVIWDENKKKIEKNVKKI